MSVKKDKDLNVKLDRNGLVCNLELVIENSVVDKECFRVAKEVLKQNPPKGFRKHLPVQFIESKSNLVRPRVLNDLINKYLGEAIQDAKINPFAEPEVDFIVNEPGKDLSFKVEIVDLPELDYEAMSKETINKLNVTVPDEEVDNYSSRIISGFSEWNVKDSEVAEGLGLDFLLNYSEKEINLKLIYPGENRSDQKYLEQFVARELETYVTDIADIKKTAESVCKLISKFKGKGVGHKAKSKDINLELKAVYEIVEPELNEGFLRSLGATDGKIESFKESVKELLEFQLAKKTDEYLSKQFSETCKKKIKFDIPAKLLEKEAKARGVDSSDEGLKNDLKFSMVVSSIVRLNNIELDKDRVESEIAYNSRNFGNSMGNSQFRSMIEDYARNTVATSQAINYAVDKMQVQEQEVDYHDVDDIISK
jgi:trigger factor